MKNPIFPLAFFASLGLLFSSATVSYASPWSDEVPFCLPFDYDGVIPSAISTSLSEPIGHPISVYVVDTNGNRTWRFFTLWNVATVSSDIATLEHTAEIRSVSFSPDGSLLAAGASNGATFVWDIDTGKMVESLTGHGGIISLSFSPDGSLLAAGSFDSRVFVWDVNTGENVETLAGHTDGARSVLFSPDGSLLAAGTGDGVIFVWDVDTGEIVETLVGHADGVESAAFAPDGSLIASGSYDRTVKLWDLSKRTQPRPQTLVKISGDDQQGVTNEPLANPLIVEVRDQHGAPLQDVPVTFTVIRGDGTLFFLFAEAADESERNQLFALAQELIGLPEGAQLYQNAPNPFNSQTVFSYFLLTPSPMRLEVFTLSGQRVAILSTGPQQAGRHRLAWDGRDSEGRPLASGVYLYRLVSAEGVLTRKLILLR